MDMDTAQERNLGVQTLVVKSDAETIAKITQAYESMRQIRQAHVQEQREAGQRIEEERRSRVRGGAFVQ